MANVCRQLMEAHGEQASPIQGLDLNTLISCLAVRKSQALRGRRRRSCKLHAAAFRIMTLLLCSSKRNMGMCILISYAR